MPKKLASEDRLRLMKFVCSFAWADLQIAEQERTFVKKMIRRLALTEDEKEQVSLWLEVPPRAEELDPEEIPMEHREIFIKTAREMIEADGDISEEELENFLLFEQILTSQ